MPNIGFSELVVILLILMLVFGASRLPKLGESMGKAIRNFKRAVAQNENIEITKISDTERKRLQESKAGGEVTDAELLDDKHAR
jgi:sec-independent protein translocase protein TatA